MSLVVCPTLLFIEDNDWKNDVKREYFYSTLNELLELITKTNQKIYWNDKLGSLLWSNPSLHPWFDPNSYEISNILYQNIHELPDSIKVDACICTPNIRCNITTADPITPTLSLIHYLNIGDIDFDFCVDKENDKNFSFSCKCHNITTTPHVLSSFKYVINTAEKINSVWNNLDINKNLYNTIHIVASKYFDKKTLLYDIDYEKSFIDKVMKQQEYREAIIYAITKRLTKYQKQATQDKSLKDEPVRGKKDIRRFRVKEANGRIHYTYIGKYIKFIAYYTEGEHDDGL